MNTSKSLLFLGLLAFSLVLYGCVQQPAEQAEIVCEQPYIQVGFDCCLDKDGNKVCDKDEVPIQGSVETPVPSVATEVPQPAVCGNTCASNYNQNPYPDCTCVLAATPVPQLTATPVVTLPTSTPSPTPTATPMPTPTPTSEPTLSPTPAPTPTPTPSPVPTPSFCSDSSFSTLTTALLSASNDCRSTRVARLCTACPTCCTGGNADTEYVQSQDADCYSCANSTYGVARARDYYDRMGLYEKICSDCPAMVTAYSVVLNYSRDNSCLVSDGWKLCKDVELEESSNLTACNTDYSALLSASNDCRSTRVARLCTACPTCCTGGNADTEYVQSQDADCYSCAESVYGVARAREYYDRMGLYAKTCSDCTQLSVAYQSFLQYEQDNNCVISSGWQICKDVSLP